MPRISYDLVTSPHRATQTGQISKSSSGAFYWNEHEPNPVTHAILATNIGKKLIGIQKFDLSGPTLIANATYVWPLYQDEGIASSMWDLAIHTLRITTAEVKVITDRGKTLVASLAKRHPEVIFRVVEGGKRRLKDLKGAAA